MAILPGALKILEQTKQKTRYLEQYLQRLRDERDRKHREELAARLEALKGSIEKPKPIPWSEVEKNWNQLGPFLSGYVMGGPQSSDRGGSGLPGRGGGGDPFSNDDSWADDFDLPGEEGGGGGSFEGEGGEFGGAGASSTFETLMASTGSTLETLMASTGSVFETLMGSTSAGLSSAGGSWEG